MKLLSIIIPTYNMEHLLSSCLDSLVLSSAATSLDVVVVNDGSKDRSLEIAQRYAERYPSVVRVIDKPNGNYGSTINAALPTLKGAFVKILDADDSFDCRQIAPFTEYLSKVLGADMVVAPFTEITHKGCRTVHYNLYSRDKYNVGEIYKIDDILSQNKIQFFMMHSIAYRTELMQQIGYRQTEGVSYTDQQWCFFPIFFVESITFSDIALYRYNLTREGQTMDAQVQLRSIGQMTAVVASLARYFAENKDKIGYVRRKFLEGVVMRRMQGVLRKYLLEMDDATFSAEEFNHTLSIFDAIAPQPLSVPVNNRLNIDLLNRWRVHGTRYPMWYLKVLRFIDSTLVGIYRCLFG